jgi:hypothetical protein
VVNSIALKTIKTTMMNNFTIFKHIKLGILGLSFSIDQVIHLVYEDLYAQHPNIGFIKIYIVFYDQNNDLIENLYFFSKDNIKNMSKHSYQIYITRKLTNFLEKLNLKNIKEFEMFVTYNIKEI